MSGPPRPHRMRFGEFELDVPAYELRRSGRRVRLERLAMDLLILLVAERDRVVTRNEIVERLWGPDVFVEVDASVNTLVLKLRRGLGDAVDHPRFIQTVQGKGYRFIAKVDTPATTVDGGAMTPSDVIAPVTTETRPPPEDAEPLRPAQARSLPASLGRAAVQHRWTAALALLFLSVSMAFGARMAWSRYAGGSTPTRVAVMPFENLTRDPEWDYLADGLTDETSASLGQVIDSRHVTLIGRISTKGYKDSQKSPKEIGMELQAAYLVSGSMRAENERVRITARLVRVADQVEVWSHSYEREPVSLLAMQQELGTAVAREVGLRLTPDRLDTLADRQTLNAEAYVFYQKGRYLWNQLTPQTSRLAMGAYGRATALDPNYALAWAGIADALTTGPIMGDIEPRVVRGPAHDAAERAVKAGSMLAEAQTSAAVQKFFLEWDWRGAEAGLRQAIQIDGSYAMAHRLLAVVLSHSRRHDEARAAMSQAKVLEPEYAMNHALSAMVEFHAGDLQAAVDNAQRAFVYEADFWVANYHLGQAYERQGQDDRALAALATSARMSRHGNSKPLSVSAYVLAKTGRRAEALGVLAALEERASAQYVPPYARAMVYAGLGDRNAAFEWLEKAFDAHDVHLIFLPVDPKWDPFREDPRFVDLVRRCGFFP